MIGSAQLGWTLTLVFLVTAGQCLVRCLQRSVGGRRPEPADRVSYLMHFMMSVAMLAMVWPWGMSVPIWPQAVLFVLAAVWFVVLALWRGRIPSCPTHSAVQGRWHHLHHAWLMAAMVWMLVMMPLASPPQAASAGGGAHAHHGSAHGTTEAQGSVGSDVPLPVSLTSLALAVCCLFLTLRWLAVAVDAGRGALQAPGSTPLALRAASVDIAHHAAMSVGMAVMLWAMF